MHYKPEDHTFVLCAYGESPYLEDCIRSLFAQTVRTRILIATSTPSAFLEEKAEKYGLKLFVNQEQKGIGADWNFAIRQAKTPLVTIAHQDDIYEAQYTEQMLKDFEKAKDPLIWFCDYQELRNGHKVAENRNLRIKRTMLLPLRLGIFGNSRFVRRRILALGSPICCPAVTYVKEKMVENPFSTTMKVSLDWDQWEKLSREKGAFIWCKRRLMCHRIHEESATTELIASHIRKEEDLQMFRRFWPEGIARAIYRLYSTAEESNASEKHE